MITGNIATYQKVHLVDLKRPWKPIEATPCAIIVGKKFCWALDDHGKRHLLGGSAFYLLAGAERRKLDLLNKIIMSPFLSWKAPYAWRMARQAWVELKEGRVKL